MSTRLTGAGFTPCARAVLLDWRGRLREAGFDPDRAALAGVANAIVKDLLRALFGDRSVPPIDMMEDHARHVDVTSVALERLLSEAAQLRSALLRGIGCISREEADRERVLAYFDLFVCRLQQARVEKRNADAAPKAHFIARL